VRICGNICTRCGEPLSTPRAGARAATASPRLCADCQARLPEFAAIRSFGAFRGRLRDALHRLKYQRDVGLGEALSKHLIELYNDLQWEIDLVAPVPLSPMRARERGYNQSGLLARPLAYAIQRPYQPGALLRTRETRSQVGLTIKERQQNVDGAFSAKAGMVKGKIVLVVDDVMTTGSTISACSRALLAAGASAVYGLTLARAISPSDADDRPIPSYPNGGKNGS
jgi:ComF family protein